MKTEKGQGRSFTYKRVSLRRENQGAPLVVETIRLKDLCNYCRTFLGSSERPVYVYGCIHPDSLCSTCRDQHEMEIEINARKAVVSSDLCSKCLVLVQDPLPRLCKVWGGIDAGLMCKTCRKKHMLDADNFMIDPGTLCTSCKLLINSTKPDAKPVKGGIISDAVCNECKRKSRNTSRDCAIDLATLCSRCVLQVEEESPKIFFVKGSIPSASLCSGCGPLVSEVKKLTPNDICVPCKRRLQGHGGEIPMKGCIDARRTCDSCVQKIQALPSTATVDLSVICKACKEYTTGRKEELSVRGGLSRNNMCASCAKKIPLPIDARILAALCDDCLDTIPRCGYLERRFLCGVCCQKLLDLKFVTRSSETGKKKPQFRPKTVK